MEIVDTPAADRIVREHAPRWRSGTFLAWLGPADLRALLVGGELLSFGRGRPLIREGEPSRPRGSTEPSQPYEAGLDTN